MKRGKVLVVAEHHNLDADAVILRLRDAGWMPVRFSLADLLDDCTLSLSHSSAGRRGELKTRNRTLALEDIQSLYWTIPSASLAARKQVRAVDDFAHSETLQAIRGLVLSVPKDARWMNFPPSIELARNRLGQLAAAAEIGLETPRAMVTSQLDRAAQFCAECDGQVVLESMGAPLVSRGHSRGSGADKTGSILFATILAEKDFHSRIESADSTPCFIYEYVEKLSEIRVVVVGERLFAVEIGTELKTRFQIDWRRDLSPASIARATLPATVAEQCLGLTAKLGLAYCTIDFIRTPDGRHVFVECNHAGRFLPLQRQTAEFDIVAAISDYLAAGA